MAYTVRELSSQTFSDFEKLASKQGVCWCMYYQRAKPFAGAHGQGLKKINQRDKKALVKQGKSHATLVYENETPVGWCQCGAKEELPRIDAGRGYRKVGRPAGAEKLWRITCFFVDKTIEGKALPSSH